MYLDSKGGKLREELVKTGLGVKYNVTKEQEVSYDVNKDIHMIWVGSALPRKYVRGPVTFANQNPSYRVHLWLDNHTLDRLHGVKWVDGMILHNVNEEDWTNADLVKEATNYAMISDILRLEIIYRFGGIYADIDSVSLRPFGPVFRMSFVTLTPMDWFRSTKNIYNAIKDIPESASNQQPFGSTIQNCIFGLSQHSKFLKFAISAQRQNFWDMESAGTIKRTGPGFLTEAFAEFGDNEIQIINWDYTMNRTPLSICFDDMGDADWNDKVKINRDNQNNSEKVKEIL